MNRRITLSFLLEYLSVILFFSLCAAVSVRILAVSYHMVDLSARKRTMLEFAQNYIEAKDYRTEEYRMNEEYEKTEEGCYLVKIYACDEHMEIEIDYNQEILLSLPFYGEVYE